MQASKRGALISGQGQDRAGHFGDSPPRLSAVGRDIHIRADGAHHAAALSVVVREPKAVDWPIANLCLQELPGAATVGGVVEAAPFCAGIDRAIALKIGANGKCIHHVVVDHQFRLAPRATPVPGNVDAFRGGGEHRLSSRPVRAGSQRENRVIGQAKAAIFPAFARVPGDQNPSAICRGKGGSILSEVGRGQHGGHRSSELLGHHTCFPSLAEIKGGEECAVECSCKEGAVGGHGQCAQEGGGQTGEVLDPGFPCVIGAKDAATSCRPVAGDVTHWRDGQS